MALLATLGGVRRLRLLLLLLLRGWLDNLLRHLERRYSLPLALLFRLYVGGLAITSEIASVLRETLNHPIELAQQGSLATVLLLQLKQELLFFD